MELTIGQQFSTSREVTDEFVRKFADVSGDYNPIHLDEEFAKKTRFGRRIAHGMLSGAFISAVLGNEFKDLKIVYLSQTMKFTAPVYPRRYRNGDRDGHKHPRGTRDRNIGNCLYQSEW